MRHLTKYAYDGHEIQLDLVDGKVMANATAMCKVFGRLPKDWIKLETTQNYISAYVRKNPTCKDQLVTSKFGSPENGGGTWINEALILRLAAWLNVDFEIWMDEKIAELLRTGKTEITSSLPDYPEALRQLAQKIEYSTQLQQQINEAKPAVSFYEDVAGSKGVMLFRDAAKSLGFKNIGQNNLFEFCRLSGLIDAQNMPYQTYVNMGIFEVIIGTRPDGKGGSVVTKTPKVTPKGLEYLHRKISKQVA